MFKRGIVGIIANIFAQVVRSKGRHRIHDYQDYYSYSSSQIPAKKVLIDRGFIQDVLT